MVVYSFNRVNHMQIVPLVNLNCYVDSYPQHKWEKWLSSKLVSITLEKWKMVVYKHNSPWLDDSWWKAISWGFRWCHFSFKFLKMEHPMEEVEEGARRSLVGKEGWGKNSKIEVEFNYVIGYPLHSIWLSKETWPHGHCIDIYNHKYFLTIFMVSGPHYKWQNQHYKPWGYYCGCTLHFNP